MKSYSPLRYPGGKGQVYHFVVELLETNGLIGCTYIEPYAGGAGVAIRLLFEDKVKKIIINDYDPAIYAFWYAILNHTDDFVEKIEATEISMENWFIQKEIQTKNDTTDLLSLGFSTFFLNRTNRSGIIKAGVIGGKKQEGTYKMDCRFNKPNLIKLIRKIATFKGQIELHRLDALDFLEIVKRRRNQFYFIDPPYYQKGKQLYTNFYSHDDHVELANYFKKKLKSKKILISYDNCSEIETLYKKQHQSVKSLNYSVGSKRSGEEIFITQNLESIS